MRRSLPLLLASLLLVSATSAATGSIRVTSEGRGVIRGDLGPASGTAVANATAALQRFAGRLGAGNATFGTFTVRHSIIGTHVRGRELRGGVPVDGTSAAVHVIDGRIIQSRREPRASPDSRAGPRSAATPPPRWLCIASVSAHRPGSPSSSGYSCEPATGSWTPGASPCSR